MSYEQHPAIVEASEMVLHNEPLRRVLQGLVEAIDVLDDDPKYAAVWQHWTAHFGRYEGPNIHRELSVARAFLQPDPPKET